MNPTAMMLAEFDQEMKSTRRVLERLPEDRLDWRPHPRSWTVAELAGHVINIPRWGAITFQSEFYDVAPAGGPPPTAQQITSVKEGLERFDSLTAEVRKILEGCSEESLAVSWSLLMNGATRFTLPRAAVWRSMVMNHLIHHRAELCVYLRLLDQPLPAIYGPSADEKM
ncbi:MAG: DinB family protein [bacterium]|jgi:uncharacterized damage-inducible protein DinB|nr:DinB family protein [bacterium]